MPDHPKMGVIGEGGVKNFLFRTLTIQNSACVSRIKPVHGKGSPALNLFHGQGQKGPVPRMLALAPLRRYEFKGQRA
jgi:hypothetical protein